jgi:hypothetical protein
MKSTRPTQLSAVHKLLLGAILIAAAAVRLWGLPSYFPQFWDEALYISEAEGIISLFSVNVGSYALLKLGHLLIGRPVYPQVICSLFGIMTVWGCYVLGRRILPERSEGMRLGLLMAAQAALLPYFVRYSRHALADGFALCFFVWALWLYLGKSAGPKVKNTGQQKRYLLFGLAPAATLAAVPACSYKFLLPTVLVFFALELFTWRTREKQHREFRSRQSLAISIVAGMISFAAVPLVAAAISGYTGWLDRVVELSEFHASMETLTPAFHFLLPVHLWYLGGPVFICCILAGFCLLAFGKKIPKLRLSPGKEILVPAIGFAVYFLFFGGFSHLQSARLYVLTLPFLICVSALAVIWLGRLVPRLGHFVFWSVAALLVVSSGFLTVDYISSYSSLQPVCDALMQRRSNDEMIYANAKTQMFYGCFHSRYNKGVPVKVKSFVYTDQLKLEMNNPPLSVIEDATDLVATVASQDKRWFAVPVDSVRERLQDYRVLEQCSDLIVAAPTGFYKSPHYYLEDLYSPQSLAYMRQLLPQVRDSVYVYVFNPDKARAMGGRPDAPVIE